MNQPENGAVKPPPLDPSERLRVYELLWAKLNQEGDGIWSRFNIILALHLALFAGFAFFFTADPPHRLWREFSVGIASLGVLASFWALAVLKGLWVWHRHWKSQLVKFEEQLCDKEGWLKPQTALPEDLPFWRGAPGATQPVFLVLLLVWAALIGVAVAYGK